MFSLQLQNLKANETPSQDLRETLMPYLIEAGIDADRIDADWNLAIQGRMLYFVIDKQRRELDEIAKGNYKLRHNFHIFSIKSL